MFDATFANKFWESEHLQSFKFQEGAEKNDISRGLLADKFYVESFASQFFLAEWKFSSISNAIERIEGKPKATQTDELGNYSFFCSERWKLVAVEISRPEEKVFFFQLKMKRNLANDNAQRSVITAILDDCNRVTIWFW